MLPQSQNIASEGILTFIFSSPDLAREAPGRNPQAVSRIRDRAALLGDKANRALLKLFGILLSLFHSASNYVI
jgi:hypothetical protein